MEHKTLMVALLGAIVYFLYEISQRMFNMENRLAGVISAQTQALRDMQPDVEFVVDDEDEDL